MLTRRSARRRAVMRVRAITNSLYAALHAPADRAARLSAVRESIAREKERNARSWHRYRIGAPRAESIDAQLVSLDRLVRYHLDRQ